MWKCGQTSEKTACRFGGTRANAGEEAMAGKGLLELTLANFRCAMIEQLVRYDEQLVAVNSKLSWRRI